MTTLMYRRRAVDCLQASHETDDPKDRLELLRMALAWAELARLAESNQPKSASCGVNSRI